MPPADREAQARELASELEWRFRLRSDTAPAQTFGDCMTLILAYGDRCRAEAAHVCSGCHHRWDGPLKGAELCGDCWRKAQPVVFAAPPREEPEG